MADHIRPEAGLGRNTDRILLLEVFDQFGQTVGDSVAVLFALFVGCERRVADDAVLEVAPLGSADGAFIEAQGLIQSGLGGSLDELSVDQRSAADIVQRLAVFVDAAGHVDKLAECVHADGSLGFVCMPEGSLEDLLVDVLDHVLELNGQDKIAFSAELLNSIVGDECLTVAIEEDHLVDAGDLNTADDVLEHLIEGIVLERNGSGEAPVMMRVAAVPQRGKKQRVSTLGNLLQHRKQLVSVVPGGAVGTVHLDGADRKDRYIALFLRVSHDIIIALILPPIGGLSAVVFFSFSNHVFLCLSCLKCSNDFYDSEYVFWMYL